MLLQADYRKFWVAPYTEEMLAHWGLLCHGITDRDIIILNLVILSVHSETSKESGCR